MPGVVGRQKASITPFVHEALDEPGRGSLELGRVSGRRCCPFAFVPRDLQEDLPACGFAVPDANCP